MWGLKGAARKTGAGICPSTVCKKPQFRKQMAKMPLGMRKYIVHKPQGPWSGGALVCRVRLSAALVKRGVRRAPGPREVILI